MAFNLNVYIFFSFKAIFENILVDLPLAEFFLAKLLVDRAPAHYLKSLDPVLYRNLLYLRDYNGDISDLGLDFTTVNNDLGETRVSYVCLFKNLSISNFKKIRSYIIFRFNLDSHYIYVLGKIVFILQIINKKITIFLFS